MVNKAIVYSGVLKDYLILTKPGIVLLVLITTLTGMYFAQRGFPDSWLIFWTLLGTGLASAGSAGLNQFFDRDLDALMERTKDRPLPSGSVNPKNAFLFSLLLILLSTFIMVFKVNLLATSLVLFASLFYVVVYTLALKRKSPLATEVGGVSGALPPVIGYAAVRGELGFEALILFLIMFLWQPPHFWVLAIKYAEDYRRAGIPTLPVAKGVEHTKLKTLIYTAGLLPMSLLPSLYGIAGHLYFLSALLLSLVYLLLTLKFTLSKKPNGAFLFFYSVLYITLLFSVMVFDMRR
ncbi:MAG: heme o synthase [Aquificaceae bacterium]|nr:heme o synthase [Aquificaceae bacterium]MCS7196783.1 heme o synthase [Aquificaceae bacterium]MCX7990206.1 heme o synthase [Aquificaceae bacterium]MDW8032391.1 heme o synthase [Aquificaceae bacterium]MDW8294305.1 heme o synthase [Aquificaceae bacterium]